MEKRCRECGILRYSLDEEGICTACQNVVQRIRQERDIDGYHMNHAGEDFWTRHDYS